MRKRFFVAEKKINLRKIASGVIKIFSLALHILPLPGCD